SSSTSGWSNRGTASGRRCASSSSATRPIASGWRPPAPTTGRRSPPKQWMRRGSPTRRNRPGGGPDRRRDSRKGPPGNWIGAKAMWRDTGRPVRVVFLDARACLPLLVFVVYWSWTTFYIAATGVIVFSVISWAGLTVPSTLRMIRRALAGRHRPEAQSAPAGVDRVLWAIQPRSAGGHAPTRQSDARGLGDAEVQALSGA